MRCPQGALSLNGDMASAHTDGPARLNSPMRVATAPEGEDVPDARRPRELEGENAKLKKLLAEAHLDIHALNTAFGVKR